MTEESPRLWGEKPYHSWNYHLRQRFGEKVFKISLNAGFTCPNRDGRVAVGGCIFCGEEGSGHCAGDPADELKVQFAAIRERYRSKWPKGKYIAYFQAYSNTYAPASELRRLYETVLEEEGVVGLSISTRPDCLPDDVVELLAEMQERTYLWVELGLQSSHDETLGRINRGHDYASFLAGVEKLRRHGIQVCAHLILGLPGEDREMMLETARRVANLPVQGVKLHLLHLLKNTPMVKLYEEGGLNFLEREEYCRLVVDILEILPPEMVIHRLTGDAPRDLLIEPKWTLNKWAVLQGIEEELKRRNTWQGKEYRP